ncbi:MAG: FtsH protease activity modulator HflK [Candidatus Cloacimonetes bacterium]|nr:FtsH protease activity modulator HflK [Candidatus Cloacimonadota bacterium]
MADVKVFDPQKMGFQINRKTITWAVIGIIVVIFLATGLYTINPEEVGVIQRFGKYTRTAGSGLHFMIPFGVEQLTKVKVEHVFKQEFGYRTIEAGVKSRFSNRDFSAESLMLTGDLNIADVEWIVQFRINDPVMYLFNVRNVEETLRNVTESVTRLVVGDRSVDEVIVLSRKEIAIDTEQRLQKVMDEYKTGISIVTVQLQNVNPPKAVQKAFNEVNSAKQEEEKFVNQALQQMNQVIEEAKGKAKRTVEEAEGYAINRTNRASGDAERFNRLYIEYRKAKSVTRKRIYIETMLEILNNVNNVYIVDEKAKNVLPLLNIQGGGK